MGNEAEITRRKEGEGNLEKHQATRAGRPVEEPVSRRGRKTGDSMTETDTANEREISQQSEKDEGRA